MDTIRKAVYWLGLLYFRYSPIERGKWRLLSLLSSCLGSAKYERHGVKLWLKPVSLLERMLIMEVELNPTLTAAIERHVWHSGYFLDIGANFGYFSLLAASNGANVIAFEPSPRELGRLHRNIVASSCHRVTVFPLALSDSECELRLSIADEGNPGLNTLRGGLPGIQTVSVAVSRLSEVLGRGILERIELVKLDVEGHELHVLSGMESVMECFRGAEFIVEITPSFLQDCGHDVQQIYEFFRRHGFKSKKGIQSQFQWDESFFYESK